MKKTLKLCLLFLASSISGLVPVAQQSIAAPKKARTEQAKSVNTPAPEAADSKKAAFPSDATTQKATDALLVLIVDSSPSVRDWWEKMRESAKEIIKGAPNEASVAVVGIDSEAVKSEVYEPSHRAEAIKFVDSLTVGGHFTDLSRGSDAGLALIQGAAPTRSALVYLTDGKLTVPKTFRIRNDFYNLLRREFTARRNISVVVINVRGDDSATHEPLPANVRIVSLKSAAGLREVIDQTLAPTIAQALKPELPVAVTTRTQTQTSARRNGAYLVGGLGVVLFILVIIYAGRIKTRAKRLNESAEDMPTNVIRPEDLIMPDLPRIAEPLVLLTVERTNEQTGRKSLVQRTLVRNGERIVIGNSNFADLPLEGLKQSQTLQIGFDGKAIRVYRLKPQTIGELDQVWLNRQEAPIQFEMGDNDALAIGSFSIKCLTASEDAMPSSLTNSRFSGQLEAAQSTVGRRRQADAMQLE